MRVPRGRPRNLQRRETILEAAERLFGSRAFLGAKMREIATAAGIGETLLYRYFPSKAALADALARRATTAVQVFVADALQRFGTGPFTIERLNDFGRRYSLFLHETYHLRCCWHAMPERFASQDAEIADASEALQRLADSMFARLAINHDETRSRTLAYLHAIEGYATRRTRLPISSDPSLERYVSDTTEVFTH